MNCQLVAVSCRSRVFLSFVDHKHLYFITLFTDLCLSKKCQMYANCVMLNSKAVCVCPDCSRNSVIRPVCGSNGLTYVNMCNLQASACSFRSEILVAKDRACGMY